MTVNLDLFSEEHGDRPPPTKEHAPLAEKLRPVSWDQLQGVEDLDKNLIAQLKQGQGNPPSLILWGPPGSGKTTIARLIGKSFRCNFVEFSAVLNGVKEVRDVVAAAKRSPMKTVLFVDEIHRFNKGQQDAFLPHVESGAIVLLGATTENPSFYLTGALLSRMRVVPLPGLSEVALAQILQGAAQAMNLSFSDDASKIICTVAGHDARRLINLVESYAQTLPARSNKSAHIPGQAIEEYLKNAKSLFYDRSGEEHYNMSSAFIKSMRGSDPDAALYWGFRMIESGEDPRFIIRRMMIFASEDIGNAEPFALALAVATSEAFEKLGMPEGRIPIAQCITYLACAEKSNRSYMAMHGALAAIEEHPKVGVPLHLRNAPTKLMKSLDYHKGYQYPHDTEAGYVPGVQYLPDEIAGRQFYRPKKVGREAKIAERLEALRAKKAQ